MLKNFLVVLVGILLSHETLLSQTIELSDSTGYTLDFSTYLAHTDKYGANFDITTDSEGYTYISGNTRDRNFPATEGAYQTKLKGEADTFIAKFTPDGNLVFATLIGGTKREHHTGIIVDSLGYIYIAGGTHSADFPVTESSYDTTFNGEGDWAGDVYVTKLNPSGSDIVFSTFLGGKVEETASAGNIGLDSKGNIIIGGCTCSEDFPATNGVINNTFTMQDIFLSKLSAAGDRLLFSTSLGTGRQDMITALTTDDKDNIFVTGYTVSDDLPVTENALRKEMIFPNIRGFEGGIDHFVAKVNESGTKVLYLSYLGSGGHMGSNIAWTSPNRLMVCGSTREDGYSASDSADGKKNSGERDGFIVIFNSEDMTLQYSTLLGGSESDHIISSSFLNKDTIVVGGKTNSPDFPLSDNALYSEFPVWEKTFNNTFFGRRKSFISVIDIKKNELLYSTYFGACIQFKISPDVSGNISFMGEVGQRFTGDGMTDFPLTEKTSHEMPTFLILGQLKPNFLTAQKSDQYK